jgi:hypothetical protein
MSNCVFILLGHYVYIYNFMLVRDLFWRIGMRLCAWLVGVSHSLLLLSCLSVQLISVPASDADRCHWCHKTLHPLLPVLCASRSVWILLTTNFYDFDIMFYEWHFIISWIPVNLSHRKLIPIFVTVLSPVSEWGSAKAVLNVTVKNRRRSVSCRLGLVSVLPNFSCSE